MKFMRSGKVCMMSLLFIAVGMLIQPAFAGPPESIKVGAVVPMTGRMASGGKDVKAGYELAIRHLNEAGGVFVKEYNKKLPLELIMLDDESDPVKTASRLEKLYSVDKVIAYLGGFSSLLNVAGMSIAEKNKVPWIGATIAVESPLYKGFKYVFVSQGMSEVQSRIFFDILDSIPKDQRPTKVANFELQTDWGKECGAHIARLTKERGYGLIVMQYAPVTKDFSSLILEAKSAGADALFSVPTPPQSIGLIKQMKELDYAPKATAFIRGADLTTYWEALGKDALYIMSDGNWSENMPYPGNERLRKDYHAQYPNVESIGMPVGLGYACVQMLADSIERSGDLDRKKIRDALAAIDMVTVKGPIKFGDHNYPQVVFGLRQWQDGKQELIWPPDIATSKVQVAPPWSER